jgi:opacity protein-like surface antigen
MRAARKAAPAAWGLATAVAMLSAHPACGQEPGRLGIVVGYPASVGLIWSVSDSLAVRPEFTVSRQTGESSGPGGATLSDNRAWSLGLGVSALLYFHQWEDLRAYVAPRFGFGRASNTSVYPGSAEGGSTATSYALAGSLGAEYRLGSRFSVFGEAGIGYTHQRTVSTSPLVASQFKAESTSNTWGTRSALGVVFYF